MNEAALFNLEKLYENRNPNQFCEIVEPGQSKQKDARALRQIPAKPF